MKCKLCDETNKLGTKESLELLKNLMDRVCLDKANKVGSEDCLVSFQIWLRFKIYRFIERLRED